MTCQIIKQGNLSNRDAIKVEEKEMKRDFFDGLLMQCCVWKKEYSVQMLLQLKWALTAVLWIKKAFFSFVLQPKLDNYSNGMSLC